MRKRITVITAILLCMCLMLAGGAESVVSAREEASVDTFSGDVGLLKRDNGNYVMQVTVENSGKDFSGTVQVIFGGSGVGSCAYHTEITLPEQGKKQFTLTIPERAAETVRGLCALNFLDGKGNVLQSISLKNVFGNTMSNIPVGILSDNYSGLTYLDAGGNDFTIMNMTYPLKLIELNNDNLDGYLEGLYFLIIDQFNVETMSEENIQAIQDWVEDGGWLIIGTGEYAEQTLSGFDKGFLDIMILDISEPGDENIASTNAERNGYYYNYRNAEIDFTQMTIAQMENGNYNHYVYETVDNPALSSNIGNGAVSIFFFSLGDPELKKLDDQMIMEMYNEVMYRSNSFNSFEGYSELEYTGQRLLAYIDSSNTNVDFTLLEVLIGFYVVLAGPILYLILRRCKKSEWYWICVPVLGLGFIAGVFFFGRGIRVNETKAYSVTVQRVDSNQADTFFLAYHSGLKEWSIPLKDNYETAGPGWVGYYRGRSTDVSDYYYAVHNGSDGLSIGIKPRENFENGYLYAKGRTESKGNITGKDITGFGMGNVSGIITNDTACDMAYMAVYYDSYIMVFSDVKAGESLNLKEAAWEPRCVYQSSVNYYDSLMYDLMSIYRYSSSRNYKQDDMSALLIGLGIASETALQGDDYAIIAGVVENWEKASAGKCNEISYGCLYSFVDMGVR